MKKIILFFMLCSFYILADIVGVGIGETEILAKKSALDELSQQIEVKVDSLFYSEETNKNGVYSKDSTGAVNLVSSNFLIGVEYYVEKIGKNYSAKAVISKDKAYFYEDKVREAYNLSNQYYGRSTKTKSFGEKKSFLLASLKELKKGNSYKNISFLLGSQKSINPVVNEFTLNEELQKLKNENLDKLVVYIELEEEKFLGIKNIIAKSITQISRENGMDVILGDKNYNNTTFQVRVVSYKEEIIPPFYYNNKKLSDTIYKSDLVLSFELKDSFSGAVYETFTYENSSKSFQSPEDALNLSSNRIMKEAKEKLTISLGNIM